MSSKFREHLSISLPPNHLDIPIEKSKFSPASTVAPSSRFSPSFMRSSSKHFHSTPKDIEAGTPPTSSGLRDRFTKLFFELRTFNNSEPDLVPIQDPRLSQWPPLHIEKRRCTCHFHDPRHDAKVRKQKRRSRCLLILLIIILLLLIGNTIFLNVHVLSLPSPSSMSSTSSTTSIAYTLSADAQQCLSQYTLNAPTSPTDYPCSTCLPTLQTVPSSYTSNTANSQNTQQITNAVQFCGLRAIYETANSQGQATLGNGSWAQDVRFCAWTGVSCDGSGRVASLQLTFPGVPATLPNEIGALTGLETLQVVGGNSIPAGSLPASFTNLTSLMTLHLEATFITSLPDTLFSSPGLTHVSTLALVRNLQMGPTLPSSLTGLTGLQSLLINSQSISPSLLSSLTASPALTASLHTLDLTSTSLTGAIPSTISSITGLTQLLLGSNNLTGTVPTFPGNLQVLELNGNSGLSGNFACSAGSLQQCSVQGTTVNVSGCGACQNSTGSNT
ncbi:L domain-like protein [Gyrodon lividus]|nr:L domain-like protein [Gyrodon lividus]